MAAYDATGFLPRILEKFADRYGGNVVGAGLIVLSSLTLAAMMAAAKDLSTTYSVWQIVLMRSIGVAVMLTPLIVRSGGSVLKSERFGLQIVRVLFGFVGIACLFYSIAHLPLAEAGDHKSAGVVLQADNFIAGLWGVRSARLKQIRKETGLTDQALDYAEKIYKAAQAAS